jgi:hypothetical protein
LAGPYCCEHPPCVLPFPAAWFAWCCFRGVHPQLRTSWGPSHHLLGMVAAPCRQESCCRALWANMRGWATSQRQSKQECTCAEHDLGPHEASSPACGCNAALTCHVALHCLACVRHLEALGRKRRPVESMCGADPDWGVLLSLKHGGLGVGQNLPGGGAQVGAGQGAEGRGATSPVLFGQAVCGVYLLCARHAECVGAFPTANFVRVHTALVLSAVVVVAAVLAAAPPGQFVWRVSFTLCTRHWPPERSSRHRHPVLCSCG